MVWVCLGCVRLSLTSTWPGTLWDAARIFSANRHGCAAGVDGSTRATPEESHRMTMKRSPEDIEAFLLTHKRDRGWE